MNKFFKSLLAIVAFPLLMLLTGCDSEDAFTESTVKLERIDMIASPIETSGGSNLTLAIGYKQSFEAVGHYSDGSSRTLTELNVNNWHASNYGAGYFDKPGVFTANNEGHTILTAIKDGVISNTVDVNVSSAVITAIQVTPSPVDIAKGQAQPLTATATFSDGTASDISGSVTWVPVDTATAAVSPTGLLSGVETGKTTLTAFKDGVISNTVEVNVSSAVITAIQVTPSPVTVAKGQAQQLTATATFSDGTASDISRSVAWVSADTAKATVSPTGLLSGVEVGHTTLTALKDGVTSNTVVVNVSSAVITAIQVTPSPVDIAKGQTQQLTAIATFSDGTASDLSSSVTWAPVDTATATVSSIGLLSAVEVGNTTLTATKDGVTSNTVDVNVSSAVITAIQVTPSPADVAKGQTEPLTATATFSDGTVSDISRSVAWVSADTAKATVSPTGLLSGVESGYTTLTAFKDGVTSNTVDVNVSSAVITVIQVIPPVTVAKGQTEPLTATATFSDGKSSDLSSSVVWAPVDTATAAVFSSGLLFGVEAGNTTLTAFKDGVTSNTVDVNVSSAVITDIQVTPSPVDMAKGQTELLTATATFSDGTVSDISRSVAWTSADTAKATVSPTGLLSGVEAGNTTLTAFKDGVTSNKVDVNISSAVITAIQVTPSPADVAKGQTEPLTATATFSDGTVSDISRSVAWASVDTAKATVSPTGLLSGVESGYTTLTALKDGVTSNTVDVNVSSAVITDIQVTPSPVDVAKGQTEPLTATATFSDGTVSDISSSVTWAPADTGTAAVFSTGLLSGVEVGNTTLTAIKDGVTSNTVVVNVSSAVITAIQVTPSPVNVAKGQTEPLTATATFSDGTASDISSSVAWLSADTATATVSPTGLLSGVEVGNTTLTAFKDGVTSNTVDVNVSSAVITAIQVNPLTVDMSKGQTEPLTARATFSDGTVSDISNSVAWVSADTAKATVSSIGLLAGVEVGHATLTAFKDGVTSNTVDVNVSSAVITAIQVTPSPVDVAKGQAQQLTATATFSDRTVSDISRSVAWLSVDTAKATVSPTGLLSGVEVGNTTLTATKGGVTSDTVDVNVSSAVITAIQVTPSPVDVAKGQGQQLTATARFSDGTVSNLSSSVAWVSADTATATVSPTGLLSGVEVGKTTLTAFKDGVTSNTVDVNVSSAVITAIQVNPSPVDVAKSQTEPLTATATFSDGNVSDISSSVAWVSADTAKATVSPTGLLAGVEVGHTTLTAFKDGVTSNKVDVNVSSAVITDIQVTPSPVDVAKGQAEPLTATARFSDGTVSNLSSYVSWTSADTAKATVSPTGLLSGVEVGNTTLTAFKDGVTSAPVVVNVSSAVITDIQVTPSPVDVAKGQTEPLTATATFSDRTSSDISNSVTWTPVDKATATVSSTGLLSGIEVGKTTLTAFKDGVTSNKVDVNVSSAVITAIQVTPSPVDVAKGQAEPLTATATFSDGTSSDISRSVVWVPADIGTAAVFSNGLLSGVETGKTTLTAIKDGVTSNTVDVNVSSAVITAIQVTPSPVDVAKGQTEPLTATATFSDGTVSDISSSVTWLSADTATATVSPTGLLAGVEAGNTTLTAFKDGVTSNTVDVNVSSAVITAIQVTPSPVDVAKGQAEPLTATATFSDGTVSDISSSVAWLSADTAKATVSPTGLLAGVEVGNTTLTAFKDGVTSNTVDVNVSSAVITAIQVTPSPVTVAKGQTEQLTATATFSDGTSSDISRYVTWAPADTATAAVFSTGLLFAVEVGHTTLTAIKDGVTSNTVDVNVSSAVITGIQVTPSPVNVGKGQAQQLTATATFSDRTSSDISNSVTWTPVDTATAAVSPTGLLSGVETGKTTLTAFKDGVISNTVEVSVSPVIITAIRVTPSPVDVAKGLDKQLTATATFSDGSFSDISRYVSWTPVDTATATVSADGLLAGVEVGNTTLTAFKDGVTSDTVDVNVSSAVITAIQVTPSLVDVAKGLDKQLTARATFSDGVLSDISNTVAWASVDTATATVSPTGLLAGVEVGHTTLTAFKDGVTSNKVDVNVSPAVITAIQVTHSAVGVAKGQTEQLTATAELSDRTSSDISSSVAWLSADMATATVSPTGLVSGVKVGHTTLTANKDGVTSNTVDVNVCANFAGMCIDIFDTGTGKLFTSSPSVGYLDNIIGYSPPQGITNTEKGTKGPAGEFYAFKWADANALCDAYNRHSLRGRTNWYLATKDELKTELYDTYGNMFTARGWPTVGYYWSETPEVGANYSYYGVKLYSGTFLPKSGSHWYLYASCVSNP
ncbi:Ig-like domain-containing protein [Vibrio bathopelagicus]|uniref:Ig-like domain-containing protein n=1 Tax=Vibrio bathopelagicus TaxID=2777577 RepID=UPI001CF3474B|nr:Ig-like domain-containing protein [Vibrio bathopelagicus]